MGRKSLKSCSMSILPIDIFASEILPRLPSTTLLRFKCLNKKIFHYISSKQFINLHLQHSISSNPNHHLLVFTARIRNRQCLYLLDVDSPDSRPRYLPLPKPFCDKGRYLKVVGSCNGLLCLNSAYPIKSSSWYHVMILNPSTGTVLANISMPAELSTRKFSGFGYDSLNNDYKLVVVEYYYQPCNPNRRRKVTVYSMKANSWRCIDATYFGDSQTGFATSRSICVLIDNWLMHWLLRSPDDGKRSIVCFNFKNEEWAADVALPDFDDYHSDLDCIADLGVLGGCLCLSVNNYCVDKFDVWIMKEYGVQASWTKFSIVSSSPLKYNGSTIFTCERSAIKEILFTKNKSYRSGTQTYEWYNIRDQTKRELQVSSAPCNLVAHMVCLGTLATGFGDCQTQTCEETQERMEIDNQVEILHASMEH